MGFNLLIANAGGGLDKNQRKIASAFKRATQTANEVLALDDVDVVCVADKSQVIPEIGIGGFTPNRHLVYLYIDPEHPEHEISESEVFNTLCHEFHHARRYDGPGYGKTLFDSMVFEGLATAFEDDMSGGKSLISSTLLKRRNTKRLIDEHQKKFQDADFNYFQWFIHDKSGNLPRWAGYEMGYYIVRHYLAKQNKKASDLVLESPETFTRL